eukprot:TRINITY_DN17076_c0_g1_i1.p1 TRINITY_DN17076_c0_g1~~TRINITY_DN17076_c0_g1_i1.p1  ORF type:complete len:517 (+),score=105.77 TRINITY_DN17076_c0_g1_i1:117-1667(+)
MSGSGSKKTEDMTDENIELKKLLKTTIQENKMLKAQLKHVSLLLDNARHEGYDVQYDVTAGLQLANQIEQPVLLTSEKPKVSRSGDETTSDPARGDKPKQEFRERPRFTIQKEFDEHQGSVFCARFSPDGKLVASGSFDKTVRIFGVYDTSEKKSQKLEGHTMMIPYLSWSPDSQYLVSASFDSTCRLWDIGTGQSVAEYISSQTGFMLSTAWHCSEPNVFLASHSCASVYWYDRRAPSKPQMEVTHPCMVNSIQVLSTGQVMLGDRNGTVSTIDIRNAQNHGRTESPELETPTKVLEQRDVTPDTPSPITPTSSLTLPTPRRPSPSSLVLHSQFQATTSGAQISHISTPAGGHGQIQERFMAVNGYDNILRLYDRGGLTGDMDKAEANEPKMACKLMGQDYKNNGFPIHSSFWVGDQVHGMRVKPIEERTWSDTMLLATGSCALSNTEETTTCMAYVYDVTDVRKGGADLCGQLFQKLSGHSDIVYGVHCHTISPFLLTYSADSTVKIWSSRGFA